MSWEAFVSEKLKSKQYANKSEAKKDIVNVVKVYRDLHPKEDIFVGNDGSTKDLICLKGTIPVNFKGNFYNIPVKIWLYKGHPFTAPMVYVTPTSSMVITPGKHVDNAGRVYLPYLTEWKYSRSDTVNLINVLCTLFGQECPVRAKPPPQQPPYQPMNYQQPSYPPATRMPMPGMPSPYPHQSPYPQPYQPPRSQSSMPYPNTAPYPVSTQSGYPQVSKPPERQGSVIADEHIRASLLSTVEDKLKRRVKEVFQMGNMELEKLENNKNQLEKGNRELQDIMAKMKDQQVMLLSNIAMFKQKNEELEENIEKLEQDSNSMNIDEAVVTTTPLYNQILDLFAEESAVEDAIYYLSDALRREIVTLEVFLKTVRTLSRRQFMLRATLQKARVTAGLSIGC